MIRKRAALLRLYNVSGETTVTAHALARIVPRLPDAAVVRKDDNSEQYLDAINN
jgi:DNA polymerase III sliding clamp (beta) subunit (PCNA family)